MVSDLVCKSRVLRENIRSFVSGLQKRGAQAKSNPENLRVARGLGFLFFAIILSWVSIQATEESSILFFQTSHWPRELIWKQTLSGRGLTLRKSLGEYSKLLESNPGAFLDESKIWVMAGGCAVFIPKSPYLSGGELWTCEAHPKMEGWRNLGSGQRGFDRLLDFFEKIPPKPLVSLKKPVNSVDPKEFHY